MGWDRAMGMKYPGTQEIQILIPILPRLAQLQSPSDYICTSSRNLARALIQPTHSWNYWWLLPRQHLELWMSLSLSRSPGLLELHEGG